MELDDTEQGQPGAKRRTLLLLAIGAAVGLALAVASLLRPAPGPADSLPERAVARVNDTLIQRSDFEQLIAGYESDSKTLADAATRQRVVDRLIDEELLVQHALDLGLAQIDRRVRADLSSALIASVVARSEQSDPSEAELQSFYSENRDLFTQPGRMRARQIFFQIGRGDDEGASAERAERVRRRLASGEPFAVLRDALGDSEVSPLPDAYLPAGKLREYLGPTALRALAALEVGAVSDSVRSGTGIHLLQLLGREEPRTPSFEEIEDSVRREWRRQAADRALRSYLDELRRDADVVSRRDLM